MHTAASEAPLHACTVMSLQSVETNHRWTCVAYTLTIYIQPVTILAGSKGHDSELPASYHQGTALIGQAEKKQLMGSGENVAESTLQGIDSFYLVDYDICITVLHGAVRP